uniref:Uncharacterized protein LOC104227744 n=1 Tax=Nicotiana sylvestris TaxID=4096 RepID=A0A1U7WI75_NICSY|nr:PREDICTED: uncharacterized protein LOC104227744 [Nicotiana sylvestris]
MATDTNSDRNATAKTVLLPEIGPDGIARESPAIAYTEKIIEDEQLQLRKYIDENYSKIRDVERELANLSMEMKLTAGPKKAALEQMRKKIEMSTEKIHIAKLKEEQVRKAWEAASKAVKDEEDIKQKLCEDLNNLVRESSNSQLARLEELKRKLEALNPSRASTSPALGTLKLEQSPTYLGFKDSSQAVQFGWTVRLDELVPKEQYPECPSLANALSHFIRKPLLPLWIIVDYFSYLVIIYKMSLEIDVFGFKSMSSGNSNVMITSESLMGGSNYLVLASSVELWCKGQGVQDHLIKQSSEGDEKAIALWTCYLVWAKARTLYTNDISCFYDVTSRMINLKKQELDMSTYLGQVQTVMEEFEILMPVSASVSKQQEQRQKIFLVLTLAGLPHDLDSVRDQILASPTVPTVDELFSRLLRLAAAPSHPVISSQILDSSVLESRTGDVRSETTGNQGFSVSKEEYNELLQYRASKQTSPQVASVAQTDTHVAGNSFACVSQSSTLGPWVMDSGASAHISGNKLLLSNIVYSQSLPTVTLANGCQTKAQGVGQANPLSSITLDSVLYVPSCPFSFASVSRLTRAHSCGIYFIDDSFIMQDRSTRWTIGIGRESESLYYLNSLSPSTACLVTDPPDLIHRLLGHPSLSKLQRMVPSLSSLYRLECESCQLGKHTRASFTCSVESHAESVFSLVHSDIWGPSRVSSTLGFRYFVSFIDDYSRCTWLFLMKDRSELFSIFQSFCAEIKNQFGVSIRIFRKRKNRHLIETARTLLIESRVPLRFWGDAVLTACCLINMMPLSPIKDQIPHSILFPQSALYPLPPRKGYHCYSPDLLKYLISADVTFFESKPFFTTDVTSADHHDISEVLLVSTFEEFSNPPPPSTTEVSPIPTFEESSVIPPSSPATGTPLLTYHRRSHLTLGLSGSRSAPDTAPTADPAPSTPIALRKVYVDDIVITGNDQDDITNLKQHLFQHFQTKDLGRLKYFLDIEVAQSSSGCRPVDTSMDPNSKLLPGQGEPLSDPASYRWLVGKLNYLTVTRPDISYPDLNPVGPAPSSITQDVSSVQGTQESTNGSSDTTLKEENARNAAAENGLNQQHETRGKKKINVQGRRKGIGMLPKSRVSAPPSWTRAGFDVDGRS